MYSITEPQTVSYAVIDGDRRTEPVLNLLRVGELPLRAQAWVQSAQGQARLASWPTRWREFLAPLDFRSGYRQMADPPAGTEMYALSASPEVVAALDAYCREHRFASVPVQLSAFAVVLARYTGQAHVVVTVPASDATLLLLDIETPGELSFTHLVARVAHTLAEVETAGGVPFAVLEQLLAAGEEQASFSQIIFAAPDSPSLDPAVPYELLLCPRPQTGAATISYSARFDPAWIARFAAHYQALLLAALQSPQTSLGDLPLLTPDERQEMLVHWNHTALPLDPQACIHTLVAAQAARTPQATALICGTQRLSYAELDQRANRLAQHLRSLGVEPGVLVGVCMERSADMLVGLLSILKAGGAYVPLDPNYPEERIAFMLGDTRAPVVLTQQALRERLEAYTRNTRTPNLVCLDSDWPAIAQVPAGPPLARVTPAHCAYIIYTSGSTGRPKGVMISHRNAVAMLVWAAQVFPAEVLRGTAAVTSICFDLSVYELFLPLSRGGTVILADNALALQALPARDEVTLINTVPSAIQELLKVNGVPGSVRVVNLAGEPLKRMLVRKIYAQTQAQKVYNLYGPSEDTTYSTFALARREDAYEPTIGRPIGNTQAYVLDKRLQPVPVGVLGELYLGGEGVSLGYLGRPALTAGRYLPDPFSDVPGARMYYTGDVVRYRSDGEIEFLGRSDHQVKIRGFRIELGEIDAVLGQHPNIAGVVVEARENAARENAAREVAAGENAAGEKRLVAYYVAAREPAPSVSELRRHVQERLPEYMTPSIFVRLDAMPMTPTGKINRKALPAPDHARPDLDEDYVAPRTLLERTLVAIWQEVLRLDRIGVRDNFFELGGQSLLATQAASRITASVQKSVSIGDFFEYPTVAQMAGFLEQSTDAARGSDSARPLLAPHPVGPSGQIPITAGQHQIWFAEQLNPNVPMFNIPIRFRITGEVNPQWVERSLNLLVARHEALRTTFVDQGDDVFQVVQNPRPIAFAFDDLRSLPELGRGDEVLRLMNGAARRPFDLQRDVLLRGLLLRLGDAEYTLLVTVHHIAFDGWSTGVLMQEFSASYNALATGQEPQLPDLPLQYPDFSFWQAEYVQTEAAQAAIAHWRAVAGDEFPFLSLPADHPRPAHFSYRGAKVTRTVPQAFVDALDAFGRKHNASLFMTFAAALAVLLFRYSHQEDLTIGVPIANRNGPDVEGLLGYFLNTLPFRIHLSGNLKFGDLLRQVRQVALSGYAHRDFPFEQAMQNLTLVRDLSRNSVFQVMLAVQNLPSEPVDLAGAKMSYREELNTGTSKVDLTLFVEFLDDGPVVFVEYCCDLFEEASIRRLLDHYLNVLRAVLVDDEQSLAALALLAEAERRQYLVNWNATQAPFPADTTLARLVEAQVARTPDAVAVCTPEGGTSLSYRELNAHANRLARHLLTLGVAPDVPVALCMPRSGDMLVALLAVLKAGGAYLPIDPAYPRDRIAYMLDDAAAPVVLTHSSLLETLPLSARQQVICLDEDAARATYSEDNLVQTAFAENIAYIIYTSGSTGRPKGVQITHAAIANFLSAMASSPGVVADDTVLALTTLSFDIAGLELWLPLSAGARIALVSREASADAQRLIGLLDEVHPTLAQATPATWRMLLDGGWSGDERMRVLCGGEALPPELAQRLRPLVAELWNLYGPTETTVWSTAYRVEDAGAPITIGRPVANTEIYILDANFEPVPVNVSGDLYIGGAGLARGYRGRPGMTAGRFIPHPFSPQPGARLYATGDLARYRADGSIEFLGRNDFQVKVRGYRIELGEIEKVMEGHETIRHAVVTACDDGHGAQMLVAYYVAAGETLDTQGLRALLGKHLPDYMVPGIFIPLSGFPLTPSGKVDRKALPTPDLTGRQNLGVSFVAPRNDFEEIVADVWQEVLAREELGVHDNFFELGGHSLFATQVVSRLRDRFDMDLSVRIVFEAPTIARLAARVEETLLAEIVALDAAEMGGEEGRL